MINERIVSLREANSWTQEELAERSGLSLKQIQELEQEDYLPALAQLIKIARVFGTRLGTFLDDQELLGAVVCHAQDYKPSQQKPAMHLQQENHLQYFPLASNKSDRHMEPLMIRIPQTDGSEALSTHEGEEFIYVMQGVVCVKQGEKVHTLFPGDTIYFDSVVPHAIYATQADGAQILAVVYTPF